MESSIFGFRKNHDIYTSEHRYFWVFIYPDKDY